MEIIERNKNYKESGIKYTRLIPMKKKTEDEIRQKKYESDKEIEFNELRQKSFLVQKIISSIKNIYINFI